MTGRIFDITVENVFSFGEKATLSMQGVDLDSKPSNYDIIEGEIVLRTAVIYGANGSGKTNFIKFLDYFLSKLRESMDSDKNTGYFGFYEPFLLDKLKSRKDAVSSVVFRFYVLINDVQRLYTYEVFFNRQCFLRESLSYKNEDKEVILYKRQTDRRIGTTNVEYSISEPSFSPGSVTSTRLVLNLFLSNHNEDISPAAEFLAGIEFANGYNRNMFERMWADTKPWLSSSSKHLAKLEDFLKHVDVQFQSITIPDGPNARIEDLTFQHVVYRNNEIAGSTTFPYIKESVGTSSLFLLGSKVIQALEKGCPLLVDEMDTNFHGFVTKFIVQMFQDKRINCNGSQLILTTHNINLMDEKLLRKDQVWFTSKNKKGASDLYSLADFDEVSEDSKFVDWYMASRFGGVPKIDFSMINLFQDGQTNH